MKHPILGAVAIAFASAILIAPASAVVPASTGRLAAQGVDPVMNVKMHDTMMMKHHKKPMHKKMMHKKPMMKSM